MSGLVFATGADFPSFADSTIMQWLIAFHILLLIFQPFDLSTLVMPWVKPVHQLCLNFAPASDYRVWYHAIVCGENLSPSMEKNWFQQTGLIHVIVVSGSHLVFLEDILRFLKLPNWLRWSVLLFFSLASNLQPPITRALIQRVWNAFFQRQQIVMRSLHLQLLAGVTTLALFPSWWTSLSFLMSWLCVLALSLPMPSKHPLWQAALIYLLLIPAMLNIQTPHPAGILFNVMLAPVLGFVLFPMSLIGFFHPWLAAVSDAAWRLLFFLFSQIPLPEAANGILFSSLWLIIYLVLVQFASFGSVIFLRRKLWTRS